MIGRDKYGKWINKGSDEGYGGTNMISGIPCRSNLCFVIEPPWPLPEGAPRITKIMAINTVVMN